MELKRILARDIRAANEKAVTQYGSDVLVISSNRINGLTELIVAVDIPPLSAEDAEPFVKSDLTRSSLDQQGEMFDVLLGQTMAHNKRHALERKAPQGAKSIVEVKAHSKTSRLRSTVPSDAERREAETHDSLRGREIVDMVREELTSLRREFKLSQQLASWQGGLSLPPVLMPLRDALNDAPMPMALRVLLIDSIKDFDNVSEALSALQVQLVHAVEQAQAAIPRNGVHVLAGPSGAGKSLMVARLAQTAALTNGCDQVMVISFQDQRAGAWNQAQLLNAQSGVGTFRAATVSTMKLLLEEHESRQLILIDTPGVQMNECLAELRSLDRSMQFHAVVPADVSAAALCRVFKQPGNDWSSLMLSKLDEACQPWALLQFLTEKTLSVSVSSNGDALNDLIQDVVLDEIVQRALNNLDVASSDVNAIEDSRLSQITA